MEGQQINQGSYNKLICWICRSIKNHQLSYISSLIQSVYALTSLMAIMLNYPCITISSLDNNLIIIII